MKLFSVDGPLYRFLSTLWNVVKINVLWLLCCIPIVTIGPATIAAFSVCLKIVDEREGYVGRQFIGAFRSNMRQGIPLGLLFVFCSYVIYLDFEINRVTEQGSWALIIFGIIACFVFGMTFIYAFPLSARYENTLRNTLKNSVAIATKFFVRTLVLVGICALEVFLFLWNSTTLFFGILIGPTCIFLTISGAAMYMFRQVEQENADRSVNNSTQTE